MSSVSRNYCIVPQFVLTVGLVWETIQHHRSLQQDETSYPALLAGIRAIAVSREYLLHPNFAVDMGKALAAPVTEIAWWTIPPTTDKAVVVSLVQTLMSTIQRSCKGEVFTGGMGQCVEEEDKLCVCLGWHSLEVSCKISHDWLTLDINVHDRGSTLLCKARPRL